MADINGIPYVESSDLVSAYPAVSQSLAQEVSDQLASKLDLAGGKILQIVRATDSTLRTTTSTTLVDVTGMSVTITPSATTSSLLLVASFSINLFNGSTNENLGATALTDASNNVISGQEGSAYGSNDYTRAGTATFYQYLTLLAWATPATTSAVTYKLRFRTINANTTFNILNSSSTGQMFAIEVSA